MLELRTKPAAGNSQDRVVLENPQSRRLLLALVLLVVALVGVVVKDWQFWFGSEQLASDLEVTHPSAASKMAVKTIPQAANRAQVAPATKKHIPVAKTSPQPQPAEAPAVTTTRAVLPPLDVEVVAGDTHSRIHPGSNAAKVEITHPGMAAATNAAERERMSVDTPQPSYPLLAQHMNVRGSVILQAVIGADGIIQDLHVLSGPAILASAAQQAVREWRFKPVVQNGQAVETKANITVNFTIKVADNSAKTTLAESRVSDSLTIIR
jgi:TonB family protein